MFQIRVTMKIVKNGHLLQALEPNTCKLHVLISCSIEGKSALEIFMGDAGGHYLLPHLKTTPRNTILKYRYRNIYKKMTIFVSESDMLVYR